jgi:pimeloyl-ACP methyl ester carboxylesterase
MGAMTGCARTIARADNLAAWSHTIFASSAAGSRMFESSSTPCRLTPDGKGERVTKIAHRTIEANGIPIRLAEAGNGPVVLLCHGFPESWYSWRHQLKALAEAGYRAVAPDMRGYGKTGQPQDIDQYTLFHLVGDMVGVLDALDAPQAVVVGHDWGAPVAWHCALLRPDRFRAVAGLSVPFLPRGSNRPTSVMPQTDSSLFYHLYFQEPGVAEAELERDPRDTVRRLLYSGSGDVSRGFDNMLGDQATGMVPRAGGFLTRTMDPPTLPTWLTEADIDVFAAEFAHTGFRGGLNWYRNIDRNWELLAPFAGLRVTVPALYVAGDRDLVTKYPKFDRLIQNLKLLVPNLTRTIMLPGCGHWTQQERAHEVNAALIAFLREVG